MNVQLFFIALLTGITVVAIGGAFLQARKVKKDAELARERMREEFGVPDTFESERGRLVSGVQRAGELVSSGKTSASLAQKLASAGFHAQGAAAIYIGSKALLFLAGMVVFGLAAFALEVEFTRGLVFTFMGSAMLFFVPNLVVGIARDRRRAEIRRHLPNMVDLLEICISAGLGLEMAWNAVATEVRKVSPTLADEMELTNLEINLGVSRAVAMRHMADRTGAEDISSLTALLVQSERFGASIVEALSTYAASMRQAWSQRCEESAEKMAVKMLFPMVLIIFPVLLVVMVGPAVLEIMKVMS